MHCFVYKSTLKPDHYLYLPNDLLTLTAAGQSYCDALPAALLAMLGELKFVLEFQLKEDRKLPQAEAGHVMADIQSQGFYLQLPKKDMQAAEDAWIN